MMVKKIYKKRINYIHKIPHCSKIFYIPTSLPCNKKRVNRENIFIISCLVAILLYRDSKKCYHEMNAI